MIHTLHIFSILTAVVLMGLTFAVTQVLRHCLEEHRRRRQAEIAASARRKLDAAAGIERTEMLTLKDLSSISMYSITR